MARCPECQHTFRMYPDEQDGWDRCPYCLAEREDDEMMNVSERDETRLDR